MPPKLSIGTAQFGLSYGITNTEGQVRQEEVKNLLQLACQSKIDFLDTAQSYGNAEKIIGSCSPLQNNFHIVSKLANQKSKLFFDGQDLLIWEKTFQDTCRNLDSKRIGSFLLHSASDLRKSGSHFLVDWLLSLKERGLVQRLGVSIYDSEDLCGIDTRILDIVQLPLSLYDQRLLLDGTIEKLRSTGTAIHARSIYLQGLLLTLPSAWPSWIPPSIIKHHENIIKLSIEKKCTLIDLALGFARDQEALEAIVLGLCNVNQFEQLIEAFNSPSPWQKNEWREWSLYDKKILDPRLWPR